MKFEKALYKPIETEEGTILTAEEIQKHKDFYSVKTHLFCPEFGCTARLSYTERPPRGFLKAIDVNEHSDSCFHHVNNIKLRANETNIRANGDLSSAGIEKRNKDTSNQADEWENPKPKTTSTRKKGGTKHKKDSDNNSSTKIIVHIDPSKSQSVSEDDFDNENVVKKEPSFFMRFLPQLTSSDSNKNIKSCGYITDIVFFDNTAVIKVEFAELTASFNLTEDFFSSVNKEQQMIFLKDILDYSKNHKVRVHATCQTYDLDINNIQLYVNDSRSLSFKLDEKYFKSPSYAANYINHKPKI